MSSNPFAELSATIPSGVIQFYITLMILLVIGGTLFDVWHKRSAQYFFENWKKSKSRGRREVGGGEVAALAVKTLAVEVATSAEFCNPQRRIAHLLTMYGFIAFVASTCAMVYGHIDPAVSSPGIWSFLWYAGALSVCGGGYWFWFFIRADVAAEGQSPLRLMPADLFVLSLLGCTTFALLWALFQGTVLGWIFFTAFVGATTVLFGGVPWSKFAHMFFKPAAALQKKITKADGSQENLPDLGDLTDPELQAKYPDIPTYMGETPPYMGLGIKRESSHHF
ncbi:MAG: adenylyl-sulfate reductase [Pseudomonadota bacterium]